jgi:hypothetical protein
MITSVCFYGCLERRELRVRAILAAVIVFGAAAVFAGCSGGSPGAFFNAPQILATVPPSNIVTVAASSQTSTTVAAGFATIKVSLPIATVGSGSFVNVSASTSVPSGFTPFTGGTPIAYVTLSPESNVTFAIYPTLTLTLPQGSISPGTNFAVAFNSNDASTGVIHWMPTFSTGIVSGETVAFPGGTASSAVSLNANLQYVFCIYQL